MTLNLEGSLRLVHPEKSFSNFNEIWCVHRVTHNGMPYDRSKVKVKVKSAWKPLKRSRPSVPHGTKFFTLTLHIHLTILISARWSATSFSFLTGQEECLWNDLFCVELDLKPIVICGRMSAFHWCRGHSNQLSRWTIFILSSTLFTHYTEWGNKHCE